MLHLDRLPGNSGSGSGSGHGARRRRRRQCRRIRRRRRRSPAQVDQFRQGVEIPLVLPPKRSANLRQDSVAAAQGSGREFEFECRSRSSVAGGRQAYRIGIRLLLSDRAAAAEAHRVRLSQGENFFSPSCSVTKYGNDLTLHCFQLRLKISPFLPPKKSRNFDDLTRHCPN